MQIREEGEWIHFVKTTYRRAEPVALPDGSLAYRAGTGRSVPHWKRKVPATAQALPAEIAAELTEQERGQAERWLAEREAARHAKDMDEAVGRVALTMALAAEGYARRKKAGGKDADACEMTGEAARAIWGAWRLLRAELQRRGYQERDCAPSGALAEGLEEPPSRARRGKGGADAAA